jgi:hypothetical protein
MTVVKARKILQDMIITSICSFFFFSFFFLLLLFFKEVEKAVALNLPLLKVLRTLVSLP